MAHLHNSQIPIAIVGLSGRFPGDATTPDRLWEMVSQGRSALSEVPKDRYNIDAFYHPSGEHQGTTTARGGHFIQSDLATFDAPFFKITAQEAHAMDPQQRLALELSYEALENAGLKLEDISGTSMGCYMASCVRDYAAIRAFDPDDYPRYEANGSMGTAMISNRVSWYLNIQGPSLTLDTACSSSLVAFHLACQSIRSGETSTALVGATNLILMPQTSNHLSTLQFLSPDSKSMAFNHKANGYSRGEGVSVVVLKSLADAVRDGDTIRAVVRGTSVTQDGRTPGINLPSSEGQKQLIEAAYANAGLGTDATGYFEAHGPGTPAGDPLEASAISAVFRKGRKHEKPLYIGSVKTNIGHLEAAAGLAGVVKAVYALERGQIPPTVWFEKPNPKIDLERLGLAVPTELLPWPTKGLRRASVNSFGYGGTNAHCVLDDAYHFLRDQGLSGRHNTLPPSLPIELRRQRSDTLSAASSEGPPTPSDKSVFSAEESDHDKLSVLDDSDLGATPHQLQLLVWSSHEQNGISRMAAGLQSYLKEKEMPPVDDPQLLKQLAYTLSSRRSRLSWSSFVVASHRTEVAKELSTPSKPMRPVQNLNMMFVFTGQGAQWFAMGRGLLAYPTYKLGLIQAASHLKSLGCDWDLLEELHKSQQDSRVSEPQVSQPACTALQVAAVDLLSEWGVFPSTTLGHSSGEIAAAYAKGAITRESAWLISYHRGRLSATLSKTGAMLAVALGEEKVKNYIDQVATDPKPVVACVNSPESVTLSGSEEAISEVLSLIGDQAWARQLLVKTPYHSPYMQEIAPDYLKSLEGIRQSVPSTARSTEMYSSVTGKWIENDALRSSQYWVDNMVRPVKFKHALQAALNSTPTGSDGTVILEIGPHGALQGPIKQTLKAQEKQSQNIDCLSLLMRKEDAIRSSLSVAGALYQRGYPANIYKANTPDAMEEPPMQLVDLPPFPWNHNSRYWSETAKSVAYRHRKGPKHDLLGNRDEFSNESEPAWRNYLRLSEIPWLKHFEINGQAVLSCSTMLAMVVEAILEVADTSKTVEGIGFRDVFPGAGMILNDSEEGAVETKLQLRPWRSGSRSLTTYWKEFALSSRDRQGTWTQHSTGLVSLKYAVDYDPAFTDEQAAIAEKYREEYSQIAGSQLAKRNPADFYEKFSNMGMHWGPTYQLLTESRAGDGTFCCSLQIQDTKSYMPANLESPNLIHPTALDGAFQMLMSCDGVTKPTIPKYIERIYISNKIRAEPGSRLSGFAKIQERWADGTNGTVVLSDGNWKEPLVIFEGLKGTDLQSQMASEENAEDQAKALWKLGAYSHWHIDVENSRDTTSKLLKKACSNAPQTEYNVVRDLEWAAYIVCKRIIELLENDDIQNLAPHHQLFYQYMKRKLELGQTGKLPCQSPEWLLANSRVENEILTRVAAASPEGKMMNSISHSIFRIFRGEVEPSSLISHADVLNDERTLAVQCEYISRLSHKRPLRILEIGAGTGKATSHILASLGPNSGGRLVKYTYTNVDNSSFEAAAREFKEWSTMMEFKVLDIEKEPSQQGLEEGSYDIVVASQVLHATSSISTTLDNCRKLLKQGGHIIVTALTNKIARQTMTFGVLPDWWLGENDGRLLGPELSEDEWDARLRSEGFSGIDWSFRDRDDAGWSSSIMISQVPYESNHVPRFNVLFVTSSQTSTQTTSVIEELSARLTAEGVSVEQKPLVDINSMDLTRTRCLAVTELDGPLISNLSAAEFEALKRMFLYSAGTLWLTRGGASIDCRTPELNMVVGLSRTVRGEAPEARVMTLDLDPDQDPEGPEAIETIMKVFHLQESSHNSDFEFAQRDGALHVLRVCPDETLSGLLKLDESAKDLLTLQPIKQPGRPLKLGLKSTGELDSFYFDDDVEHHSTPLGDLDVEIEVKAVGLSHQDMTIAVGQTWDVNLGTECCGVVTGIGKHVSKYSLGDRVMTCSTGWYRTFLRNTQDLFQRLPEHLSWKEGAAMLISCGTAAHSIFNVARLQAGETILIHSASDPLGRAAIQIAQCIGAKVFVTVSSDSEKLSLAQHFGIPEDHIFTNRDVQFSQGIKRMTNGKGVDVVLNSLTGEMLRQTWHCIAPFGRFIELGLKDIKSNMGLDMALFANNAMFAGVNLFAIQRVNPQLFSKIMADTMRLYTEGIISTVVPQHVMKFSEISAAFRLLQTGKHSGKVVLEVSDDDLVPTTPLKNVGLKLRSDATYIIPGGMGGLGRSLLRWMADKGARHLVVTSRRGAKDPRAEELLRDLSKLGVQTKVFACDIGDESQCRMVLDKISEAGLPPVRGAIVMAMNVQDSMFDRMAYGDWCAAINPKLKVTSNLHNMLPRDLDFFLCISSSSGQIGAIAQGNYNAGNTFQDAVAHHRRSLGLKGTSIDLGWMGDIGFISEQQGKVPEIVRAGAPELSSPHFFAIVEAALADRVGTQPVLGLASGALARANGFDGDPYWFSDARFGPLSAYDMHKFSAGAGAGTGGASSQDRAAAAAAAVDLAAVLGSAQSAQEARAATCTALLAKLAKSLMVELEDLDSSRPINTYGVDSLVAVDIRAWALKEAQSVILVSDILKSVPIVELAGTIATKSNFLSAAVREEVGSSS